MVQDAKMKEISSEKSLKEPKMKLEGLQAEVSCPENLAHYFYTLSAEFRWQRNLNHIKKTAQKDAFSQSSSVWPCKR